MNQHNILTWNDLLEDYANFLATKETKLIGYVTGIEFEQLYKHAERLDQPDKLYNLPFVMTGSRVLYPVASFMHHIALVTNALDLGKNRTWDMGKVQVEHTLSKLAIELSRLLRNSGYLSKSGYSSLFGMFFHGRNALDGIEPLIIGGKRFYKLEDMTPMYTNAINKALVNRTGQNYYYKNEHLLGIHVPMDAMEKSQRAMTTKHDDVHRIIQTLCTDETKKSLGASRGELDKFLAEHDEKLYALSKRNGIDYR